MISWHIALRGRLSLSLALCGIILGYAPQGSLQRGEELSAAGRWEEAAQVYLDAAAKDPKIVNPNPAPRGLPRGTRNAAMVLSG